MSVEEKARELLRLHEEATDGTWRPHQTDILTETTDPGHPDEEITQGIAEWVAKEDQYLICYLRNHTPELAAAYLDQRKEVEIARVAVGGLRSLLRACAVQLRAAEVDTAPLDEKAKELEDAIQKAETRYD